VNERRWAVLLLALAGCARAADPEPASRLLLGFERASAAASPLEYLRLSWVGDGAVIAEGQRIPAAGTLPPAIEIGTFEIDLRRGDTWRTIVAQGFIGDRAVAEGAVRVFVPAGRVTTATVRLVPGRLDDGDRDGIPDGVDNCPAQPNPAQLPCADAAASPGDRPPPPEAADDHPADAAAERPAPPQDAGRLDLAPPPPDLLLARGQSCVSDADCETRHCAEGRAGRFCASPDMVVVVAGAFSRGCNQGKDPGCQRDEQPPRVITVNAFEIDRTEVTQAALDGCVRAGACAAPTGFDPRNHPQNPASNLGYSAAEAYCRWAGKRLPTEAEWEKAARGPADVRLYPWGDEPPTCARAQYRSCGLLAPVPVAALSGTSYYGAEDMAGNVAEWVADYYAADYYAAAPAANPHGPGTGSLHVRRGGGFSSDASLLRVSSRASGGDTSAVGVRCARDL
jgi:formylglycine-generating enzyme required for sulfatase activity